MLTKYALKTAVGGVTKHKSRSALTILGIVIGIASIILIQSLGQGAEGLIMGEFSGLGSNVMEIQPGAEPTGLMDFSDALFSDVLKERELNALSNKANVPGVASITPSVMVTGSVTNGTEFSRPMMLGSAPSIANLYDLYPEQGRFITDEDVSARALVGVIGYETAQDLFGNSEAIGQRFKIKDTTIRVIGILPEKSSVSLLDSKNMIIVPWSTAQQYLTGTNHFQSIVISAINEDEVFNVKADVERTLRDLQGITDTDKDNFRVTTMDDAAEMVATVTGILAILLSSVAAISLVVGGIGIMNIMLVSVTERTKEIGLRKALGAKNRDILLQFLIEAVILTSAGGILGVLLGAGFSFLLSIIFTSVLNMSWTFAFPIQAAAIGIAVSSAVGLVFGIFPARQASQKSPMEALRYE